MSRLRVRIELLLVTRAALIVPSVAPGSDGLVFGCDTAGGRRRWLRLGCDSDFLRVDLRGCQQYEERRKADPDKHRGLLSG